MASMLVYHVPDDIRLRGVIKRRISRHLEVQWCLLSLAYVWEFGSCSHNDDFAWIYLLGLFSSFRSSTGNVCLDLFGDVGEPDGLVFSEYDMN